MNSAPSACRRVELGEDDVLGLAVDHQRAVAALAAPVVDGAGADPALRGEELALGLDHPPAGGEPVASVGSPATCGPGILGHARRRAGAPGRRQSHRCAARGRRARRGAAAGRRARPGPGRTEALARRLAALAAAGTRPERVLVLTRSRGGAAAGCATRRAAARPAPTRSSGSAPTRRSAERLLREYAVEAGLDPFFATVGAADRLAILLDRLDELPLRRHEIRGNPAGLLGAAAARASTC